MNTSARDRQRRRNHATPFRYFRARYVNCSVSRTYKLLTAFPSADDNVGFTFRRELETHPRAPPSQSTRLPLPPPAQPSPLPPAAHDYPRQDSEIPYHYDATSRYSADPLSEGPDLERRTHDGIVK